MIFKLIEQLKKRTPYMLRNDGELIECSPMHPYFIYHINDDIEEELRMLFNERSTFIDWFYNNTQYDSVKNEIKLFVNLVVKTDYFDVSIDNVEKFIDDKEYDASKFDIIELYKEINNATNQEFCRVRTSNMRFGGSFSNIYFRISSVGFNWFDLIWQTVYANKDWITNVTVCTDSQSRGRLYFYKVGSKELNEMPTNEFITLSGNPVLEKYEFRLNTTKCLLETFENIHPGHINNIYNAYKKSEERKFV